MDKRSPSPLPRQMDGDAGARRVVADADAAQPLQIAIPVTAIKGRGAASRLAHRFESTLRERFDDGWSGGQAHPTAPAAGIGVEAAVAADGTCRIAEGMSEPDRPPQTEVIWEDARSVLTRNDSPDLPLEVSLNPYRGCEHGCIYCYARPTHSYLGFSPGLDFETRIVAKRNVVAVLQNELSAPGYEPVPIALGSATDAYQPVERQLRLTRGVLEVLHATRHPFGLVTKSSLVERDLDVLAAMARDRLVRVYVTITTLDGELARKLEPRAASPLRRLATVRRLAEAGVPVGVSLAPQIPFVNEDMEQVMQAAWEAGARSAFYVVLRLPWELSPLFREWLQVHYPDRVQRVMGRVRELHGGRDYRAQFGDRMRGQGPWADLLRSRFQVAARRLGYNQDREPLERGLFRPGAAFGQESLF
ncbi:DNA repair photolyase [Comamonas sp. BIGb0124]|nr:DNA repair photolyase [Comamonas sp. BIGb0124]